MSLPPNMTPPDDPLPPDLRFLKRLVTVLTIVMIGGVLTVIVLLVTRIATAPQPFDLPASITLPPETRAAAVTLSRDWVLVLSESETLLLFDRSSGDLHHQIDLPAR